MTVPLSPATSGSGAGNALSDPVLLRGRPVRRIDALRAPHPAGFRFCGICCLRHKRSWGSSSAAETRRSRQSMRNSVAVMGGSAANHNNFWQLFVRPTGSSVWRLAAAPGVASNGGLVLARLSVGSVLAGFRPWGDGLDSARNPPEHRRFPGRHPMRAGQLHRGRVQPIRATHAGRGKRPGYPAAGRLVH